MYKIRLHIPLIVLTLIVNLAACKKTCYHCASLYGSGRCVRNSDTTYFITYQYADLKDTLTSLYDQGYTCDLIDTFWTDYFIGMDNRVCKEKDYDELIASGNRCAAVE